MSERRLGVALDVHLGGPRGPIVAVTTAIRNLRRCGLCRGFVVKASGGSIAKVIYFLLPPVAEGAEILVSRASERSKV